MQHRIVALRLSSLALAASAFGCAQDNKIATVPVGGPQPLKQQDSAVTNGGTGTDSGNSDPLSSLGGTGTQNAGGGTGAASGGGQSIDEILKLCGVDQAALQNPSAPLFSQKMYGYPKKYQGSIQEPLAGLIQYAVEVVVILDISATSSSSTQTTNFNVKATPDLGLDMAKKTVVDNKGTVMAHGLDLSARTALMGSNPDWNGVICTLQPVSSLTVTKGKFTKTVTFDPPLPMSLSPKADPTRYTAEIGASRAFSKIKATVTSSTDPATPSGTVLMGNVTVTPVDPLVTLDSGNGTTAGTLKGDIAYAMKFDFGIGKGDVMRLGLQPLQQLYISNSAHNFTAIVADTGDEQTGVVILAPTNASATPNVP